MRGKTARIGLVSVALLAALLPLATDSSLALAAGSSATGRAAASARSRPNIVLLISDDQAWSTFSPDLMPTVYSQLVDQGVLLHRAYVNTSLCCPSRAQIMTGLYEHNTGVDANDVSLSRPTLPQALHDVGYRTMLSGKYLNSWPCTPRPEFDRWVCTSTPDPSTAALTNPWINVDGLWHQYSGYQPDILANYATRFIAQTPANQPFFLMYTPTSPHLPADDPRYDSMVVTPPRGEAFDANTMTRGTPQFARRTALTPGEIASSDSDYTTMAHAVRSLDDAMGTVLNSLGDRSRDTLVIYMSDNGFLYGEHRRLGKNDQWEESVNVPMIVRYPAILPTNQAFVSDALVQNVDISATIAELIGLPWGADGKSFLPILRHERPLRTAALIEHCRGPSRGSADCSGYLFDGGRAQTPGFDGIVTQRYKYVEFDDGSIQLIDLQTDPHELQDLSRNPRYRFIRDALARRLHAMMTPRLQTTIVTGPGPTLDSRIAAFTFFSPSRFATYRCRLTTDGTPGPWQPCPGGFDAFGNLSDGRYDFEVAGIDANGRRDPTPASRLFNVGSSVGPEVTLLSHPPIAQTVSSVAFTYASSLAGAEFQCRFVAWDGESLWLPCASTGASYLGLTEGSYRFEVRALDPATGVVSRLGAGWYFRVDNTGPAVAFSSAPLDRTRHESAAFRFAPLERTDGPATCTVDQRAVDCTSGRLNLPHVSRGAHALVVTAMDPLGNVGLTTYDWMVDRTAPEALFKSGPDHLSNLRTAVFDVGSTVDPQLFICRLDDRATMPCFTAPSLTGLKDGDHTLTLWSVDLAMNRSHPVTYSWTVDATAPQLVKFEGPQAGAVTWSRSATFKIAADEPSHLFCSLDGAAFAPCSSRDRYDGLVGGTHTFQVYGQDGARNDSATVSRTWTIS